MANTQEKKVNVAPSSTEGHFIENATKVINLDNINETYFVEGKSKLTTKNHTTLENEKDCVITCQRVFDPFKQMFEKSED